MANAYKVLGQSAPNATTSVNIYTVPATTQAIVSTIAVCNRGSSAGTYRIAIRPAGASLANQHYIAFDTSCAAKDSVMLTLGISLNETDVVTVYASTADFSFSAFGLEIS